jgi:hypothetical protein
MLSAVNMLSGCHLNSHTIKIGYLKCAKRENKIDPPPINKLKCCGYGMHKKSLYFSLFLPLLTI